MFSNIGGFPLGGRGDLENSATFVPGVQGWDLSHHLSGRKTRELLCVQTNDATMRKFEKIKQNASAVTSMDGIIRIISNKCF